MKTAVQTDSHNPTTTSSLSSIGRNLIRWFASSTVRQAADLQRQVRRLVCEQRDLLPEQAIAAIQATSAELEETLRSGQNKTMLRQAMARLETVAGERLIPYPHGSLRENVK
jgi:hypothetical protein